MLTFAMKLASVLAVAGAAMAAPADSGTLAVMGQGTLDEKSFSVFANCVQGLHSAYKAYADEGVLELWHCIESSSSTVSLAIESSEFHDPAHETSTDIKSIQHADAVNMGVTGQKVVDHVHAKKNALETRQVRYYAVHHSDENTCRGDFNHYSLDRCNSFMSAFVSTQADNLDTLKHLRYTIWPHHSCDKGNQRIIDVNPRSNSGCVVRTTYSWTGVYI